MIFKLEESFVESYSKINPDFGFNGLGLLTYYRTYSRLKPDGSNEQWFETVRRVVEGCYSLQKEHILHNELGWNDDKAQKSAQEMYDRMFRMKFLPPGRMLWAMGTPIVHERKIGQALFNCAFISTDKIDRSLKESAKPFMFMMDMSMVGVGVGFDVEGAGLIEIHVPNKKQETFVVPDTREGWVESLELLLYSYFSKNFGHRENTVVFDYSNVRGPGLPIKGFGGISSGADPLIRMHEQIREVLDKLDGKKITITAITDIMNLIGQCVVAGNVRRCLPKGTLIHCADGLKKIEDIVEGDTVHTSSGTSEVSELVYQGEQQVLNIKTQLGVFNCTPKHQIAVMSAPGKYVWKHASNLIPGDRLVFPEHIINGRDTSLPSWEYEKLAHSTTCKDIIIPELDEEVAWFFGILHGDGYVYPNFKEQGFNASVSVACSTDHPSMIDKIVSCFQRFGLEASLVKQKGKWVVVRATSKQLAWYLSKFKTANTEIQIPEFILSGRPNIRAAYLAGLFDADGCSKNRPKTLVSSVYPEYIKQVQVLYSSLGIPTRLKVQGDAENRISKGWQPLHLLNLVGEGSIKRCETLVMYHSYKYINQAEKKKSPNDYGYPAEWVQKSNLKWYKYWDANCKQITTSTFQRIGGNTNGLIPIEVKSLSLGSIVETYDISVPEAKEFIAGHGLLVHNTAQIVLGPVDNQEYRKLKDYKWNPKKMEYEGSMAYRSAWGWASNNSVIVDEKSDFAEVGAQTAVNGEPGYVFLENIRKFSRLCDPADYKDKKVKGTNPCIVGSTLIAVADGRNAVPIKDLVDTEYPVYSVENGKVVIKKSIKTWKTRENAEIWKLTLDDGSSILLTPDHKVMLRNGDYLEARQLIPGQSLMPFNSYISNNRYRQISSNIGRDRRQYRLIAEYNGMIVDPKTTAIHHKDFNSLNDSIDNLQAMSHDEHKLIHSELMKGKNNSVFKIKDKEKWLSNLSKANSGENNRMFGKKHKDSTIKIIGEKSKFLWETEREMLISSIKNGMTQDVRKKISEARKNSTTWHEFTCPVCGEKKVLSEAKFKNRKVCSTKCINYFKSIKKKELYNHKVVSIEFYGYEDVYDMTVEDTHNFGVITSGDVSFIKSSGIFVHNCSEQSLESAEMCCLIESFPSRAESKEDYLRTLKFAYLLGKTATLVNTTWPETNRVQKRNRRIGTSVTGVTNFLDKHSLNTLKEWLEDGYNEIQKWDEMYSSWLCVPKSIKTTSVKPSGTVSLLAGVNPGCHFAEFQYYIRRVRVAKNSALIPAIKESGLHIEDDVVDSSSYVVEFPIHNEGKNISQTNIWEQVSLAVFLQKYWADNQVSCTVTFRPEESSQIPIILDYFKYDLKSISFLPKLELGAYAQMPYEAITKDKYNELMKGVKPILFKDLRQDSVSDKFCDGDKCII